MMNAKIKRGKDRMNIQEEIKENLQLMGFYSDNYEYWERAKVVTLTAKGVDRILEYLHSKGVMIVRSNQGNAMAMPSGSAFVESLIEEK